MFGFMFRLIEFCAAATAIILAYLYFTIEYPALQQDRLTNAWTLMNMKGHGGKKETLEYLANRSVNKKEVLVNIDVSQTKHDSIRLRLHGLKIPESVEFNFGNFEGADLAEADFKNTIIRNSDFRNVTAAGAEFNNAKIINTDLSHAKFNETDFKETELIDVNVSGTDFSTAKSMPTIKSAWAWKDIPPMFPSTNSLDKVTLIDPDKVKTDWLATPRHLRPPNPKEKADEINRLAQEEAARKARLDAESKARSKIIESYGSGK